MRAAYGKVLVSGTPRMTRPRARKNADGLGGFSVIDPGGNWIRVFQNAATTPMPAATPAGRLAKALANAVVQADSRGSVGQAVRILDSALARPQADDDPVEQVEVLVYRAELAMVLHDPKTAAEMLARVQSVALTEDETERAAPAFDNAAEASRCATGAPKSLAAISSMRVLMVLVPPRGRGKDSRQNGARPRPASDINTCVASTRRVPVTAT